jgi:hypothetical protein
VRSSGRRRWYLCAAAAIGLLVGACRPDECHHEGQSYRLGATFPAADGCNSCSCAGNGKVACTARTCGPIDGPTDAGADGASDTASDAAGVVADGGQDGAPDGAGEAPADVPPSTVATEEACGKSLTVRLGEAVVVQLASTYWQFAPPAAASVLHQRGSTEYAVGPSCPAIPGTGCGTATATYEAVGAGQGTIEAARTTCGEALRCPPGQGSDQCTIAVTVVP